MAGALDLGQDDNQDDRQDQIEADASAPPSGPALPLQDAVYRPQQAQPQPYQNPAQAAGPATSGAMDLARQILAGRAQRRQDYDLTTALPADGSKAIVQPDAPVQHGALADFMRQTWIGALQIPQATLGAASLVASRLNSDPATVQRIEEMRAKVADYAADVTDNLSPKARAAMSTGLFGDAPDGTDVSLSSRLGAAVADLIPTAVLAIGTDGMGVAVAKGMLKTAAEETATRVAGGAAVAAAFGTTGAGQAYEQLADTINRETPEQLSKSPVYQHLVESGASDFDARKALFQSMAPSVAALHFGVDAAAGAGLGQIIGRGAVGATGEGMLKRLGFGAAEGGGTMGAQAGADDAITQQSEIGTGAKESYDPSQTAMAVLQGAGAGALIGGVGGAFHSGSKGKADASATDETITPTVGPAETQALTLALTDQSRDSARTAPDGSTINVDSAGTAQVNPDMSAPALPEPQPGPKVNVNSTRGPTPDAAPVETPATPAPATEPTPVPATLMPLEPGRAPTKPVVNLDQPATPVSATVPEPTDDMAAQVRAMLDPKSAKDTVFVPKGTPMPDVPADAGVKTIVRKEGTFFTTDPAKARDLRKGPLTDERIAEALDYPQTKAEVAASGEPPQVVEGRDAQGGAVTQAAVTPEKVPEAVQAAAAQVPDGQVEVKTPEQVVAERVAAKPTPGIVPPEEPAKPAAPKTKGELLREKRALEKAKLAPAGERQAGRVETVEDPSRPGVEPIETPPAPVKVSATDLADTLRKNVTPLKKDGDVSRVIDRMSTELAGLMQLKTDPRAALKAWAAEAPGVIAGTRTRRGELADVVARKLTGRGLAEGRDARAALAEDRARQGAEPAGLHGDREVVDRGTQALDRAEDDVAETRAAGGDGDQVDVRDQTPEEREAEASQGVQDYGEAGPQRERAAGRDYERILGDLHKRVMSGDMSPQEAFDAYGTDRPGAKPRKFSDYGAYMEHVIREASDEDAQRRQIAEYQEKVGRAQTPQAKAGAARTLQRMLDATGEEVASDVRAKREELEQQRRDLEDKIDELRDPVGHAVTQEIKRTEEYEPRRRQDAAPVTSREQRSSYLAEAMKPEHAAPIDQALREAERTGVETSLHALLRRVIDTPGVRDKLRPLHDLAQRLLKQAPDVPVMTAAHAEMNGRENFADDDSNLGTTFFDQRTGQASHVTVEPGGGGSATSLTTLLHEAMHTVTAAYLSSSRAIRDQKFLTALRRELISRFDEVRLHLSGGDLEAVRYGLTDNHEMHTTLMSEAPMQAALAAMKPSERFLQEMRQAGFPASPERALWRSFTDFVRRAVGLPPAGTLSEHTLLDHVLGHAQDITDRAAAYNRSVHDPVVRDMAQPLLRQDMSPEAREKVARLLDRADLGRIKDATRRGGLLAMSTDAIVDRYKRLFEPPTERDKYGNRVGLLRDHDRNALVAFRDAQERIAHVDREFRGENSAEVVRLTQKLKGDPDLPRLMNEATLADVRLGDPTATNDHMKSPKQQADLADLKARFEKLTPDQKATYAATRDLYAKWYLKARAAQLGALIDRMFPGVTDAQRAELQKSLRTAKSTADFLKNDDASHLAQTFGTNWASSRKLVRALAKLHQTGFVKGDYFPLRRYGDYVVRYGSVEKGDYGVEMFERKADALARRAELAKQGVDALSTVQDRRDDHGSKITLHDPIADEIHEAIRTHGGLGAHAADIRDMVNTMLLQRATRSEAARTQLRRKGVLGASEDAGRNLASEMVTTGVRLGYLRHGADRQRAMAEMQDAADAHGRNGRQNDQIRAQAVIGELRQKMATGDEAHSVLSGVARKASQFAYVKSLMSFSTMLTHSVETHMNSISFLGGAHGYGPAAQALTRALSEVTPTMLKAGAAATIKAARKGLVAADWNMARHARDRLVAAGAGAAHMDALFGRLSEAGLLDHSFDRQMQEMAGGYSSGRIGQGFQRFMDLNAAASHSVETANKAAVAKAAFDLMMKKSGGDVTRSVAHAEDMLRKVTPNYQTANAQRIGTNKGPLAAFSSPLLQFKKYGLHMYAVMGNLARDSVSRDATPAERFEARKQLAGVLATHALMAGSLTLIADPLRYVGGAYDYFSGSTRPHDYQVDVRNWMSDTFGPEVGELMARGLPHALGIDIHNRVGLADLLEVPGLDSFTKEGVGGMIGKAMMGAAGGDVAQTAGSFQKLFSGDALGGLQDLLPRQAADVMKAISLADQGLVDKRGNAVTRPGNIGAGAVVARGLGFQPAAVSEAYEGKAAVMGARQEAQDERARLTAAWVKADAAGRAEVNQHVAAFNQAYPYARITMEQLLKAKQAAAKGAQGNDAFGLKVPKTGGRQLVAEGRFANP